MEDWFFEVRKLPFQVLKVVCNLRGPREILRHPFPSILAHPPFGTGLPGAKRALRDARGKTEALFGGARAGMGVQRMSACGKGARLVVSITHDRLHQCIVRTGVHFCGDGGVTLSELRETTPKQGSEYTVVGVVDDGVELNQAVSDLRELGVSGEDLTVVL